jgi:hypothetical protein
MEKDIKCQMTIQGKDFPYEYRKCGKPAKYKCPEIKMKVEFVCGHHKNSVNAFYKRIGSKLECEEIL